MPQLFGDAAERIWGPRWASCEGRGLSYILTLGVVDEYRRKGLGKHLVNELIKCMSVEEDEVRAVYLHVVTYNESAIKLYESLNFQRVSRVNRFYELFGKPYDSFLYCYYLRGGRPGFYHRVKHQSASFLSSVGDGIANGAKKAGGWFVPQQSGPMTTGDPSGDNI